MARSDARVSGLIKLVGRAFRARRLSVGAFGYDAREFEDPGRREVLLGDPDVFVDLDGFKNVNDTHGHSAGDTVLVRAGELLARIVQPPNSAYRLGGDEFVVLAPEATTEDVEALAVTIRGALTGMYSTATASVTLTASVGWTRGATYDVDSLLRQADANMYRQKPERRIAGY